MSMSTHVVGFRPPDEEWRKKKAAWDAMRAAGMEPPDELWSFFGGEEPDERGIETQIHCTEWDDGPDGACTGYEVEIASLPDNITHIRFFNCY